jgi:hypothetical protein
MSVSFKAWVINEGKNRFNVKMRKLSRQLKRDTCLSGTSYEHVVVHTLNRHNPSMDEADLLHWAGVRWALDVGHTGPVDHPYELS